MPSRAWPIWLYSFVLIVGYPIANGYFWMPDSSPANPLANGGLVITYEALNDTQLVCILLIAATWLCTRRYNPQTRLLALNKERPFRSILVTLLTGAALFVPLVFFVEEASAEWHRYRLVALAYVILWVPWLLYFRAALIEQDGDLLDKPRAVSALGLLVITGLYLSTVIVAGLIADGISYLFGYAQARESYEGIGAYLLFLPIFALSLYFAVRFFEQKEWRKVFLLAPVLLIWVFLSALT